jgi:hypothetical protein
MATRIISTDIGLPTPIAGVVPTENSVNVFAGVLDGINVVGSVTGLSLLGGGARVTLYATGSITALGTGISDLAGGAGFTVSGHVDSVATTVALGCASRLTLNAGGSLTGKTGITFDTPGGPIPLDSSVTTSDVGGKTGVVDQALPPAHVVLGSTGPITSETAGIEDGGGGSIMTLDGEVPGHTLGLHLFQGSQVDLGAGRSVAGAVGIHTTDQTNEIINAGLIVGRFFGIMAGLGLTLTNTGEFSAITTLLVGPLGNDTGITNSGAIRGRALITTRDCSLHDSGDHPGSVDRGTEEALNIDAKANVVNTGAMLSAKVGLSCGSDLLLLNQGLIKDILHTGLGTGHSVILNDHVIERANVLAIELEGTTASTVLRNHGVIEGDVGLSGLADRYGGRGGLLEGVVNGGAGSDALVGGATEESLIGGADGHRLRGMGSDGSLVAVLNDGNDSQDSAAGADTLDMAAGHAVILADLAAGRSKSADFGTVQLMDNGNILTGANNDALLGNAAINLPSGGGGEDTISGGDSLLSVAWADKRTGGARRNVPTGGAGVDQFIIAALTDSQTTALDVITDFTDFTSGAPDRDRINLATIEVNTTLAGDQAFTSIGSGAFVAGLSAGKLHFVKTVGNTVLELEVNNDGLADMSIVLHDLHTVTSIDCIQ